MRRILQAILISPDPARAAALKTALDATFNYSLKIVPNVDAALAELSQAPEPVESHTVARKPTRLAVIADTVGMDEKTIGGLLKIFTADDVKSEKLPFMVIGNSEHAEALGKMHYLSDNNNMEKLAGELADMLHAQNTRNATMRKGKKDEPHR
jgi:hypothetical protein